jgi:hypothetical protein
MSLAGACANFDASGNFSAASASTTFLGLVKIFDDCKVESAGNGYQVKEGANCKQGTATLNGTTEVTVSTNVVTASSRIFLTINAPGGTPGSPYVSSRSAGTSFGIKSTNAADSSTVAYEIFEPAT